METETFLQWLKTLGTGKLVGDAHYVHISALDHRGIMIVSEVASRADIALCDIAVVKVNQRRRQISLLSYPRFFEDAFPRLKSALTINLTTEQITRRSYEQDANPPILHRKELLLSPDHPMRAAFARLTADAEAAGLFHDTRIIGHQLQWDEELRSKGLTVVGHQLSRVEPSDAEADEVQIYRHKTALARTRLSTPVNALLRYGFLDGGLTFFDYGCGRGGDISILASRGLDTGGWDPHFRPSGERVVADVVNLGFVINVIEDVGERRDALQGAWRLSTRVLAVAALIGGRTAYERFRLFRDGVLTSHGTFQKYFTHEELGLYISSILGREPVSIEPGLYFVFRSDAEEQDFLARKQSVRIRISNPAPVATHSTRPSTQRSERPHGRPTKRRWVLHAELADQFWNRCLELGRLPTQSEFPEEARVRACLGNPKAVLQHLQAARGQTEFDAARRSRNADLLVFLALNLFERRRSFGALGETLRHDIREHLGSYTAGIEAAKALLFSISDTSLIERACVEASDLGYGYLAPREALFVDARLVNNLPPILRVYLGCASKLYGDARSADIVKIHIQSGKVTFTNHDDYDGRFVPNVIERVKVELRKRRVHYFQYGVGPHPTQPLFMKSMYMHPILDTFEAQREHDLRLFVLAHARMGFRPLWLATSTEIPCEKPTKTSQEVGIFETDPGKWRDK